MSVAAFDTLKLARNLRDKAKLTPEQAEGFADAIAEAMQGDLATKADLRETEGRLKAGIEATESDLPDGEARLGADIRATKSDLRETELRLKAEIETAKVEVIKWVFGTVGFQTLVVLGAATTLARGVAK